MEKSAVSKILVIGSGLTGCVTANLIKREMFADVIIWEKEKEIGGRMRTSCNPNNKFCKLDLGLQYVTATLEFIRSHAQFYDQLLDENVLMPLGNKIENFRKLSETKANLIAPEGSVSLVEHFLKKSEATVCLEHEVTEIILKEELQQWEVRSSAGATDWFDAIVITIPIPQVLKLDGSIKHIIAQQEDVKIALEQVKYSSRYAVGLYFNEQSTLLDQLPWFAKYFPHEDTVCFMAVDNRKRGKPKELPAILIHTTTNFGQKHLEDDEMKVADRVMGRVKCLIPDLPSAAYTTCHKWKFSQVIEPYLETPGCLVLANQPCLICGGDSFTESTFNGCISSALKVVEELLKSVKIVKSNKNLQAIISTASTSTS